MGVIERVPLRVQWCPGICGFLVDHTRQKAETGHFSLGCCAGSLAPAGQCRPSTYSVTISAPVRELVHLWPFGGVGGTKRSWWNKAHSGCTCWNNGSNTSTKDSLVFVPCVSLCVSCFPPGRAELWPGHFHHICAAVAHWVISLQLCHSCGSPSHQPLVKSCLFVSSLCSPLV